MRALQQLVRFSTPILCIYAHVYFNQFYQHGRKDLVDRLKTEWGLTSEMTKKSLKYQIALGQNAGETFGKIYGGLGGAL